MANLKWLGHDGFQIKSNDGKFIYTDPYQLNNTYEKADLILITHGHYDHCSVNDIKAVAKPETIIITTPDCQSKLSDIKVKNITIVAPGNKVTLMGINIEAVPAYNINKQFHPKENEWVGYIITVDGQRIYHAGDTDVIPEMSNIKNIDIALLPVSGTYVMTADEAAGVCDIIKPKLAIPMHYGSGIGTANDGQTFKSKCSINVKILAKE